MTSKAYKKQIGGSHYQNMVVQPSEFINKNKLPFAEGSAIKYICRHAAKGKQEDIHKAIHYLEMILDRDYQDTQPKDESWTDGFKKWRKEYEDSQI
jgi:hypothetical protein